MQHDEKTKTTPAPTTQYFAMLQSYSREISTFKSSEAIAPKELQAQSAKPRYIFTELGKEKLCKHCQEYWPIDSEFWFMVKAKLKDGSVVLRPDSACKGCYDNAYRPNLSRGKYQNDQVMKRSCGMNRFQEKQLIQIDEEQQIIKFTRKRELIECDHKIFKFLK